MKTTNDKKFLDSSDHINFSRLTTDQHCEETQVTAPLSSHQVMECNTTARRIMEILATIIIAFSLIGLIILVVVYILSINVSDMYSVVIDAGSTSSKLHLYKWIDEPFRSNGKVTEVTNEKVSPGISNYINDPTEAYTALKPKLDKLTSSLSSKQKQHTPVYLAATAGMRLKLIEDPLGSLDLFAVLRQYLIQSGLQIETPNERILNNILGNIQEGKRTSPAETVGSLDLGGASTQIAFIPGSYSTIPKEHLYYYPLRLYGNNFLVYSHSFLCYGKSEFERRLMTSIAARSTKLTEIPNPCLLQGFRSKKYNASEWFSGSCLTGNHVRKTFRDEIFQPPEMDQFSFVGTGNPDECIRHMQIHFRNDCSFSSCSFNNIYQPNPSGKFLAYAGFSYVMRYLFPEKNTGLTLTEVTSAVNDFCRKPWSEVARITKVSEHELTGKYCFDGLYIVNLLQKYGFTTDELWKSITFDSKVNGKSVSWALGYMLDQSGHLPSESPKVALSTKLFIVLFILFLFLLIGSVIGILITKCYSSQSKKSVNQA
ncbi:unnamed protein product [Heterobilharzia americana]|nr:unnamed protein product [Heterobilharzia americana]